MKIAVLGGGFTGLVSAYKLQKNGHNVVLFEKEITLGGLASGFKDTDWDWYLERAYHHLFTSDTDILEFAKEVDFDDIFFNQPITASLFGDKNNFRTFPVDSPQDFLRLPILSLPIKLRCAFVLAFLKASPYFSLYEKTTSQEFLTKYMGEKAWDILWNDLFRKKFGKYAEKILSAFIWARINKRSRKLGYIKGGFQHFIFYIENKLKLLGVEVRNGVEVQGLARKKQGFIIQQEYFDKVVCTLPSPVIARIGEDILPGYYLERLKRLEYLHALCLILVTEKPLLSKVYWLNILSKSLPLMFVGQHTNFIDKKHYANRHIAYIGYYLERNDRLMSMNREELVAWHSPYLKLLNRLYLSPEKSFLFKAPFAQPIFNKRFLQNKPEYITPVKNFFIANLDMTYPYDRGTNYAVKLGLEVSGIV